MANVLVLYYSSGGSTKQMARLIARGAESEGASVALRTVPRVSTTTEQIEDSLAQSGDPFVSLDDLTSCDALCLGSPTRFGNMATPLKYFLEQTSEHWLSGTLAGKPACVFTSTSSLHGGQESTLLSMMLPLLHHGMLICGLPYSETDLLHTQTGGTPYGVSHFAGNDNNNPISDEEKRLCKAQGQRIAQFANKLTS